MTVPPIVAALLSPATIALIVLALRRLARPHTLMHVELSRRCADLQTPVLRPSVDGLTAGAGTPDPAPAVTPPRVRVTYPRPAQGGVMTPDLWAGVITGLVVGLPVAAELLHDPSPIYFGRRSRSNTYLPPASDSHSGPAGHGVGTFGAPLTDVSTPTQTWEA